MAEIKNKKDFFNSGDIENFNNGDFVLSSADLIAVKYGIKKVTRFEYSSDEELANYKKALEKHSLYSISSDEALFGRHNLYISKSKKLALQAKKIDPSFKIINHQKQFSEIIDDIYQFSKLLSYPDCCIKAYLNNILNHTKVSSADIFSRIPKKINFLFNNILNGISNLYFSFHLPCSFECEKSLAYLKKIFNKTKKDSLLFAEKLKDYLSNQYLVFLDPLASNMYVSWDKRKGFIFDGYVKKNQLFYSKVIYFETRYPDYEADREKKDSQLFLLVEKIKNGDQIVFAEKGFRVLKNKTLLYQFEDKENIKSFLLNFV